MPSDTRTAVAKTPLRCPACGVPLRLRERRFIGATFLCPACREPLVLTAIEADGPVIQRAAELSPHDSKVRPASRSARWTWPLLISAGLAAMVAVVIAATSWNGAEPPHLEPVAGALRIPPVEATSPRKDSKTAEAHSEVVVAPPEQPVDVPPADAPVSAESVAPTESEPPVSAIAAIPPPPPVPVVQRADHRVLLKQRLVSFQQAKPVSRRELLATIEDLLDRPVNVMDEVPAELSARLDAPLTLALENVTVEELLRSILNGTGLEFTCTADDVQLHEARP